MNTIRSITDEYKLKTYVRIVRLLLEDDDTVSAQSYLSRAQNLIRLTNDQETIRKLCYLYQTQCLTSSLTTLVRTVAFKLSQARIYDSQRKFQEAASKYHEIRLVVTSNRHLSA